MKSNFVNQSANATRTCDEFQKKFLQIAKTLNEKDELSEEEKFAVCVACGMELEIVHGKDENHIIWRTKHKIAVVKLEGEWFAISDHRYGQK